MLEFLFGSSDPTKHWQRHRSLELAFDLEAESLNGVRLGDSIQNLSFLARSENRKSPKHGQLGYFSLGLEIDFDENTHVIQAFHLVHRDDMVDRKVTSFPGSIVWKSSTVDLSEMTLSRAKEFYGDCFWVDDDDDEVNLFYEWERSEWQLEFVDDELHRIVVTKDRVMADAQQRELFGVDKRWPPASIKP